jgi:formate hydrogenlyase transcriptional activator
VDSPKSEKVHDQLADAQIEPGAEIEPRRWAKASLAERLRFEQLLSDLSARLMEIQYDQVDAAIEAGLEKILEFFHVERSGLVRISHKDKSWRITHVAYAPEIPPVPKDTDLPLTQFPWVYQNVRRGKVVSFTTRDELPPEAAVDKQTYEGLDIRSALNVPLTTGAAFDYVFSINAVRKERDWPKDYIARLRLLGEILVNSLQLAKARQQLEERLRFEGLISDLAARFVRISPAEVEGEINRCLQRITEFFDADRCSLGLFSADETQLARAFEYHMEGVEPAPASLLNDQLPWYMAQLAQGKLVVINRLEDLPAEAQAERRLCLAKGMKSVLSIPMVSERGILGSCALVAVRAERTWPEDLVKRLQLITDVFVSALEHGRSYRALESAEKEYRTILDFTYDWEYFENPDGSIRYTSPSCERITGYTCREFVEDPHKLREIIVDEDLVVWDKHFREERIASSPLEIQFRIKRRDGEICWIEHACQPVTRDQSGFVGFRASNRDITRRKQMEYQLRERLDEIERLKLQLEEENIYLRDEIMLHHGHEEIVGRSPAMKQALAQVEQVASTDATVLLQGETGTGKELLARTIHRLSTRKDRSLVTINCAALPPTLVESELFGREKGAYTGALTRMAGRFEVANRSTLFFDEIGELSADLQVKLLRVLEEGRFERLGSAKTLQVDVRIIAATNRDLAKEVASGRFRRDLYYRLNVFPISIPPLRERTEDIPPLVWSFVRKYEKQLGKRIDHIPRKRMEALQRYPWPGNARELRNIVERAMITTTGGTLLLGPPLPASETISTNGSLEDVERSHILDVLVKTGWRVTGKGGAAEALGMKRTTLQSKMKKLGIKRPTR